MRRFARLELSDDAVQNETAILRFHHLLEQHGLTSASFDAIGVLLEARGLLLHAGTIIDATTIAARSSTKNATAARDPRDEADAQGQGLARGTKLQPISAVLRLMLRSPMSRSCRAFGRRRA